MSLNPFNLWIHWASREWLGREADWHPQNRSSCLPGYEKSPPFWRWINTLIVWTHFKSILNPSTYLFSNLPCHQFSYFAPSKSLTIQLTTCHFFMCPCEALPQTIFPNKASGQEDVLLKFYPLEGLPSLRSIRDTPNGIEDTVVYFWPLPVSCAEYSVKRLNDFSLGSLIIGNSLWGHWHWPRQVMRVDILGM